MFHPCLSLFQFLKSNSPGLDMRNYEGILSSAEARAAVLHQTGIGPVREGVEAKHELAVTVEGEDGGGDAEEVEDGPHAQHVLDGQSTSRVHDGIGWSGDRQHEGMTGGEGDPQAQVDGVDVEAGGEAQDHRD